MARRLRLSFEDASAFRRELDRNLARGGVFVPTGLELEPRDLIEVELTWPYLDESLVFEAEVVHCVTPGSSGGAPPGVALQLLMEASELRAHMDRLLEAGPTAADDDASAPAASGGADGGSRHEAAPPGADRDPLDDEALDLPDEALDLALREASGLDDDPAALFDPSERDLAAPEELAPDDPLAGVADRRRAPRSAARVPARVEAPHVSIDGRTRDLSETGVLISADASELPVGKEVRLEFTNPEDSGRLEVRGRVRRHVGGEGTVAAVAVEFEGEPAEIAEFVRGVKRVEADRVASGISGVIEELGMPNLLQMLGQSSERGTLTVSRGEEEGVVAFELGRLRYVRLGGLRAGKALARLLSWEKGSFHFHAQVDPLDEEDPPTSLEAALLEGLRCLDESRRARRLEPRAVFQVDREVLAAEPSLEKTEEAVLDLAAAGFTVRRILDVIPESDAEVLGALHALLERGVLRERRRR